MRTTAGTFSSQTIKTRTLTLSDTSGICVCFGAISPPSLLEEAKSALEGMGAPRYSHRIQIETTHFVCTHAADGPTAPPAGSGAPNPALEFQRAAQLSIPIVNPSWVLACHREKKMVPISAHYLDKAALSGGPPSAERLSRQQSTTANQNQNQQGQVPAPQPRRVEPIQLQQPPRGRSSTAGSVDAPQDSADAKGVDADVQTEEQVAAAAAPSSSDAAGEQKQEETLASDAPRASSAQAEKTSQEAVEKGDDLAATDAAERALSKKGELGSESPGEAKAGSSLESELSTGEGQLPVGEGKVEAEAEKEEENLKGNDVLEESQPLDDQDTQRVDPSPAAAVAPIAQNDGKKAIERAGNDDDDDDDDDDQEVKMESLNGSMEDVKL